MLSAPAHRLLRARPVDGEPQPSVEPGPLARPERPDAGSPAVALAFVHCCDTLIVIDKPSGLLAVPGRGTHLQDCAAARVRAVVPDALVVHRLDMATSGLMLLARGAAAQRTLSIAFARRQVVKRYVAVVAGLLPVPGGDGWGEIDLPLAADWPHRPRQKVDRIGGKPSLTQYRVLCHDPQRRSTRVELQPLTGRSHQLRVHLLALGHPILGDALYAPPEVLAQAPRLLLHASALSLAHPTRGEPLHFHGEPPF
jgi:tRNA pseudouridine32 synthase/23S rRNA pseudouridine746 synthase